MTRGPKPEPKPRKRTPGRNSRPKPKPVAGESAGAGFLVVGVGASAGGLEAFEAFLSSVPKESGLAYVLCPHLDPEHVSLLPELLQRHTGMKVRQIRNGERVEPDRVYVVPPDQELDVRNGKLELRKRSRTPGAHFPIDGFLRSLAEDQGANAVGIVLSGTGTDGTLGLREIKARGGMVVVQDPESARYDGMPRAAEATGLADFVLPPGEMAGALVRYARDGPRPLADAVEAGGDLSPALPRIFVILRARTGHDFSHYKTKTILRRIERRMQVHQLPDIDQYVRYLKDSEHEAKALFKELLIGVSSFFRNPEAFAALKTDVLPALLGERPDGHNIRVWVPGCGTGEEAYSIAMLLLEYMRESGRLFTVQIFGTDLDSGSIDFARRGLYPASIAADLTPERRRAWFTSEGPHYRVKQRVRELLVFAPQNVIRDPPFTKLDLLSCRNLLIYFDTELQKNLLPTFHYSLNPDGILFLGSSESIGPAADLFMAIDAKWRIFRRKPAPLQARRMSQPLPQPTGEDAGRAPARPSDLATQRLAEAVLEHSGAPPSVIVDSSSVIVYVHGHTGRYLESPAGRATMNVVEMAREGLKARLSSAIRGVRNDRRGTILRGVTIETDSAPLTIDVTVRPVEAYGPPGELLLISFEETTPRPAAPGAAPPAKKPSGKRRGVEELEQELAHTSENLKTTIEELETANEELKSANEEMQSTNEELQSTNEEMETSKEELQSLNEEASTVNAELQARIDELAAANDDMKNLLDSTQIATIFLDNNLCVRRFTPRLTSIIPLTPTDVGRPLRHFAIELTGLDLEAVAAKTLDTLAMQELVASHAGGGWIQLRVLPYRTASNVIDGVVITFQDVSSEREATNAAEKARAYAEDIFNTIRGPLLVLDSALKIVSANPAFYRAFEAEAGGTEGAEIFSLGDGQWDLPELRRLLTELIREETTVEGYEIVHEFPVLGPRRLLLNARRVASAERGPELVLLAIEDVTGPGD